MSEFAAVRGLLERLERHDGATADALRSLRNAFPVPWPEDYLDCLSWSDGVEGYVGGRGYLWLWSVRDVGRLNAAYCVAELAPGLVLIGSDAGAVGYGFDFASPGYPVVSIEMSAMHRAYFFEPEPTFSAFIRRLAAEPRRDGEAQVEDFGPPEWLRGKVIHEKHPSVLGGSPDDPGNRVLIPRDQHPALTVFFARIVHRIRGEQTREGS